MVGRQRRKQAIDLRDQVSQVRNLGKLRRHQMLGYNDDALSISFRTPFQRLPGLDDRIKYWAAVLGKDVSNLPYGLDIWAPRKVLNIEWDDHGRVEVVSYRAGDWEAKLRAASIAIQYPSGLR